MNVEEVRDLCPSTGKKGVSIYGWYLAKRRAPCALLHHTENDVTLFGLILLSVVEISRMLRGRRGGTTFCVWRRHCTPRLAPEFPYHFPIHTTHIKTLNQPISLIDAKIRVVVPYMDILGLQSATWNLM